MKTPLKIVSLLLLTSTMAFAQDQTQTKDDSSDKVDIKVLEEKYWSAKDDDFSVVQNRAYPKEKRFFGSFQYGVLINDSFTTGRMSSFAFGYHFSERWGVELSYHLGNIEDNDTTKKIFELNGAPDYNKFANALTVSALWVPLYAKMSFLDKKILYFDMGFGFGLGRTNYNAQTEIGDISESSIHYSIDIFQQVFLSRNFSLRFDIKNRWMSQKSYKYDLQTGRPESERDLGNIGIQDTTMVFGITYFH